MLSKNIVIRFTRKVPYNFENFWIILSFLIEENKIMRVEIIIIRV